MSIWTSKPPPGIQIDRAHPLAQGMVGCWLFNEGNGRWINDVTGIYRARLNADATWQGSAYGAAIPFASSNYAEAGDTPHRRISNGGATLAVWCRVSSIPATSSALLSRATTAGVSRLLSLDVIVTTGFCQIQTFDGTNNPFARNAVSVCDGRWHSIVGTRGNGQLILYVDGVQAATATDTSGSLDSGAAQEWRIASRADNNSKLTCDIAQALVYNRALSAVEVAMLSAQPYAIMRSPSWATRFNSTANAPKRLLMMGVG